MYVTNLLLESTLLNLALLLVLKTLLLEAL